VKISNNITLHEAVHSFTAKRLGIDNTPDSNALDAMKLVAEKVFQPLRDHVGGPIKINSFYRSPALNKAVKGAKSSQHVSGQAIDIDDVYGHATNAEMFTYILENLDYDQLIWEFGTDENPDWVHVSYVSETQNRRRALRAIKENGKTKYITYNKN